MALSAIAGALGFDGKCLSCGEVEDVCPNSFRPCGHHCNHIWSHDKCDWCGKEAGDEPA